MKMSQFLFLFLGFVPLLPLTAQGADQRPIVAVFEIEDRGSILKLANRDQLTDYLGSLLSKGGFQVVPRSQLKARLSSAKKGSYKSCYDQGCQIELGRELAAQKSLASQVLRFGKTCKAAEKEQRAKPCDELAAMYLLGDGVKSNWAEALKWYLKAAELGSVSAADSIALIYEHGRDGVPVDKAKALDWLRTGARGGYEPAMFRLATAYAEGRLSVVDLVEAYAWLAVYIEKEVQTDRAELLQKQLAAKMSPADLERARKEAAVKVKKYVTPKDRKHKAYMKTLPGR